uniref:Uncharacterized protein n=1 Tax=Anguilla anguilla TaxID=7936 RepID=A0A0E9UC39_ANGAN
MIKIKIHLSTHPPSKFGHTLKWLTC